MSLQLKQDTDEVTDNEYLEAVGLPMIKVGWREVFENEMVDRETTKNAKIFFQISSPKFNELFFFLILLLNSFLVKQNSWYI